MSDSKRAAFGEMLRGIGPAIEESLRDASDGAAVRVPRSERSAVMAPASLAPGEARAITLSGWACRCARCGYEWQARTLDPVSCPAGKGRGCGSRSWRTPAGPHGLAALSEERRKEISRQGVKARRARA